MLDVATRVSHGLVDWPAFIREAARDLYCCRTSLYEVIVPAVPPVMQLEYQ